MNKLHIVNLYLCLAVGLLHFIFYCTYKFNIIKYVTFYFLVQVDDINAAIADLKAKNIRTLSAEPRIGAHGKPVMFLHPKDCDGVLVELEEA